MKRFSCILLSLLLIFALTSCGKSDNGEMPLNDGTTRPKMPENVLGIIYLDESENEVLIYQNNDESFGMIVFLNQLTTLQGPAICDGDDFLLTAKDADGNPIKLRFCCGEESELKVEETTWEPLQNGQVFSGFMPDIVGDGIGER